MTGFLPFDRSSARAALRDAAGRTAALLASIPDGKLRIPGSAWTIGEAGAHLVIALRAFTDAARGNVDARWAQHLPDTGVYSERLAAVNTGTLAGETERDPLVLAQLVAEAATAFLDATAADSARPLPTPWYAKDATLSVGAATCSS